MEIELQCAHVHVSGVGKVEETSSSKFDGDPGRPLIDIDCFIQSRRREFAEGVVGQAQRVQVCWAYKGVSMGCVVGAPLFVSWGWTYARRGSPALLERLGASY